MISSRCCTCFRTLEWDSCHGATRPTRRVSKRWWTTSTRSSPRSSFLPTSSRRSLPSSTSTSATSPTTRRPTTTTSSVSCSTPPAPSSSTRRWLSSWTGWARVRYHQLRAKCWQARQASRWPHLTNVAVVSRSTPSSQKTLSQEAQTTTAFSRPLKSQTQRKNLTSQWLQICIQKPTPNDQL